MKGWFAMKNNFYKDFNELINNYVPNKIESIMNNVAVLSQEPSEENIVVLDKKKKSKTILGLSLASCACLCFLIVMFELLEINTFFPQETTNCTVQTSYNKSTNNMIWNYYFINTEDRVAVNYSPVTKEEFINYYRLPFALDESWDFYYAYPYANLLEDSDNPIYGYVENCLKDDTTRYTAIYISKYNNFPICNENLKKSMVENHEVYLGENSIFKCARFVVSDLCVTIVSNIYTREDFTDFVVELLKNN